jgi:hypothetical protein
MGRPDDLDVEENWHGGSYDLALQFGPRDDARLEAGVASLWRSAGVSGCFAAERQPLRHLPVDLSLQALETHGHVRGTVRLPGGQDVVCGMIATRFDDGDDWLSLYIPLGALGLTDDRVGPFPFGEPGGPVSLAWRLPLDRWLADVATQVYPRSPFRLGLVGFDAAGELDANDLATGVPDELYFGLVLPGRDGVAYIEANR